MRRMFSVYCPSHGSRVLLGLRRVRVVNTDDRVAIAWRCTCDHEGVELLSRHAAPLAADR